MLLVVVSIVDPSLLLLLLNTADAAASVALETLVERVRRLLGVSLLLSSREASSSNFCAARLFARSCLFCACVCFSR